MWQTIWQSDKSWSLSFLHKESGEHCCTPLGSKRGVAPGWWGVGTKNSHVIYIFYRLNKTMRTNGKQSVNEGKGWVHFWVEFRVEDSATDWGRVYRKTGLAWKKRISLTCSLLSYMYRIIIHPTISLSQPSFLPWLGLGLGLWDKVSVHSQGSLRLTI